MGVIPPSGTQFKTNRWESNRLPDVTISKWCGGGHLSATFMAVAVGRPGSWYGTAPGTASAHVAGFLAAMIVEGQARSLALLPALLLRAGCVVPVVLLGLGACNDTLLQISQRP